MRKIIAGIGVMIVLFSSCQKADDTPPVNLPVLPDSSIMRVYFVDSTSAAADAAWISDPQVSPITSRGIVWNTAPNPTIDLSTKTDIGDNIGGYSFEMTDLQPKTTYYVRAYATNANGTSYGVQKSFTTTITFADVEIGTVYVGRMMFYFLKPGDATYDPNVKHGFLAYLGNNTDYNALPWDAMGGDLLFWGLDTVIQSGYTNTANINEQQYFELPTVKSAAAKSVSAFTDQGFAADGFLPSKDELNQLYLFAGPGAPGAHTDILKLKPVIYWSSSQYDNKDAYWQNFADGTVGHGPKSDLHAICPIMKF